MTKILDKFIETGTASLSVGKDYRATDSVSLREGYFLQHVVKKIKPKTSLEVGLASGISSLFILAAMKKQGGKKLIGIDPSQFLKHEDKNSIVHGSLYLGTGLQAIEHDGYKKMYEFYNDTSQQVLPQLVKKKTNIDFAFIDGWHTFDHALVDFFYIDQLMNVGGVIVFHDKAWPSIQSLCKFIETNRRYKKYPIPEKLDTTNIEAFIKLSNDDRNYDHFAPFWEETKPSGVFSKIKRKIKALLKW